MLHMHLKAHASHSSNMLYLCSNHTPVQYERLHLTPNACVLKNKSLNTRIPSLPLEGGSLALHSHSPSHSPPSQSPPVQSPLSCMKRGRRRWGERDTHRWAKLPMTTHAVAREGGVCHHKLPDLMTAPPLHKSTMLQTRLRCCTCILKNMLHA